MPSNVLIFQILKKNPKLEMVILLIHDKITILIAQKKGLKIENTLCYQYTSEN